MAEEFEQQCPVGTGGGGEAAQKEVADMLAPEVGNVRDVLRAKVGLGPDRRGFDPTIRIPPPVYRDLGRAVPLGGEWGGEEEGGEQDRGMSVAA